MPALFRVARKAVQEAKGANAERKKRTRSDDSDDEDVLRSYLDKDGSIMKLLTEAKVIEKVQ